MPRDFVKYYAVALRGTRWHTERMLGCSVAYAWEVFGQLQLDFGITCSGPDPADFQRAYKAYATARGRWKDCGKPVVVSDRMPYGAAGALNMHPRTGAPAGHLAMLSTTATVDGKGITCCSVRVRSRRFFVLVPENHLP
jgi:hypothetical protein